MRVAQSAGAVLDVRLQVEERVTILGMAVAGELLQLRGDGLAIPLHHLSHRLLAQPVEDLLVAADVAHIHQREPELRIAGLKVVALFRPANRQRKLYAAVP